MIFVIIGVVVTNGIFLCFVLAKLDRVWREVRMNQAYLEDIRKYLKAKQTPTQEEPKGSE